MSLKAIVKRIVLEAGKEVLSIKKEAEKEAEKILQEAKKKDDLLKEKIIKKGEEEAEKFKKKRITLVNLAGRKEILQEKQSILKEIFKRSLLELKNLEEQKYLKLMEAMFLVSVYSGEEEIILSVRDRERMGENFLQNLNKELQEKGKKGKLKFSQETQEIARGFILKGQEVIVDCSWETLLAPYVYALRIFQ